MEIYPSAIIGVQKGVLLTRERGAYYVGTSERGGNLSARNQWNVYHAQGT